jgi:hypothetical protein
VTASNTEGGSTQLEAPTSGEPRFLVLHALTVKGVAGDEALVEVTGLPTDVVGDEVAQLLAAEHVRQRKGRIGGYALSESGKALHAELLPAEVGDATAALAATYDGFLPLNGRLKTLCTAWQLRPVGGSSEPNDHSDETYDAGVIAQLAHLHAEAVGVLEPAGEALIRYSRYPMRLAHALERVQAGEITAFTKPLTASYHDVWMELHQDLLLCLGRTRDEKDEG